MAWRDLGLSDSLPMSLWQKLRSRLAAGEPAAATLDASSPGVLSDALPMGQWQAIRQGQVSGAPLMSAQAQSSATGAAGAEPAGGPSATGGVSETVKRMRALDDGAHHVLDVIPLGEGTAGERGYDTIYNDRGGARYPAGWKRPTSLTVDEAIAMDGDARRLNGDYAVGKYQFKAQTLGDLKRWMGLKGGEVMAPDLQDRMARELLHRKGYDDYLAGRVAAPAFQRSLAGLWDSLPATADGQTFPRGPLGRTRQAPVAPAKVVQALSRAKAEHDAGVQQRLEDGYAPVPPFGWR